jgi:hypothetical protein
MSRNVGIQFHPSLLRRTRKDDSFLSLRAPCPWIFFLRRYIVLSFILDHMKYLYNADIVSERPFIFQQESIGL